MTPDEFVIIDDKPGKIPYPSTINQVLAYSLAFKSMINKLSENPQTTLFSPKKG